MEQCECYFTSEGEIAVMCESCLRKMLAKKTEAITDRKQLEKPRPRKKRQPATR